MNSFQRRVRQLHEPGNTTGMQAFSGRQQAHPILHIGSARLTVGQWLLELPGKLVSILLSHVLQLVQEFRNTDIPGAAIDRCVSEPIKWIQPLTL
jgi:hypothetical protein